MQDARPRIEREHFLEELAFILGFCLGQPFKILGQIGREFLPARFNNLTNHG